VEDELQGMDQEFKQGLMEASHYHQSFIQMTSQKGRFDTHQAAQCVERSESMYSELLNRDIHNAIVLYQLATLYMQTNRNGLAINLLEPLIKHSKKPKIEWLNNLGAAYRNEHCNAEARDAFEAALKLEYHPDVLANLCALWVNEGNPAKGIPYGRQCLGLRPDHPQGNWNLGLLLIENKQYEEGFKFYANGFETGERIVRSYKDKDGKEAKFWKGEDTRIVLDVHPRLFTAIQRSFPDVMDIFPTRKSKETPEWNDSIRVDYKDGLGSLPRWYHQQRRVNSGWLKPNAELTQKYKGIIRTIQEETGQIGRPVVGIAWTGGKKKTRVDLRSIPLEKLVPVLENDATFVSLEYIPGAEKQTGELLKRHGIYLHHWPDVVEDQDYEHSMALAAACDLVICVNTSMVHVRGSMDLLTWTLTPHGHAWRYGKKDELNPFYNSVIQYHQDEGIDWEVPIQKVTKDLKKFCRGFKP
jgi:tetratricopeptide (TPR) repeat protein